MSTTADGAVSVGVGIMDRPAGPGIPESRPGAKPAAWLIVAAVFGVGPPADPGAEPGMSDMTRRSSWTILSYMAAGLGRDEDVVGLSA